MLADESATQLQVNEALETLTNGMESLVVDKTELEEKVVESKELTETDYSAEIWAEFEDALAKAEEVLVNEEATKAEVDEALKLLTEAMENLAVDKALLEDKVTEGKGLTEADYTAETWTEFADALAKAEEVLADESATQSQVNEVLEALANAMGSLELIESPTGNPYTGINSGSTSPGGNDITTNTTATIDTTTPSDNNEIVTIEEELTPLGSGDILNDITGHWAEEYIKSAIDLGIISGYPDNTFRPNASITRAEFVTLIVKGFDLTGDNGVDFKDTTGHWASEYIKIATSNGYVSGYGNNLFLPNKEITREEAVVVISLVKGLESTDFELSFSDKNEISHWANESVKSASYVGIISGNTDNKFLPKNNISRGEAITIIMRGITLE